MQQLKKVYPISFGENYTPDNIQQVHQIIDWLNGSDKRSQSQLSKVSGIPTSTLNTLIKGVYKSPPGVKLAQLVHLANDNSDVEKKETVFIETSITTIIRFAAQSAVENGVISVVIGDPGVGKTISSEQVVKETPGAIYICGCSEMNSKAILEELCYELGISVSQTNYRKMKSIQTVLLNSRRLIILDEADKCQKNTIEPLRNILDKTGIGVVLVGNKNLRSQLAELGGTLELANDRVEFFPTTINSISRSDNDALIRSLLPDSITIHEDENEDKIFKHIYSSTNGGARKLAALCRNIVRACVGCDTPKILSTKLIDNIFDTMLNNSKKFNRKS